MSLTLFLTLFPILAASNDFDPEFMAKLFACVAFLLVIFNQAVSLKNKMKQKEPVNVQKVPELVTREELQAIKKAVDDDMTKMENDLKAMREEQHRHHVELIREINATAGDIHTRLNGVLLALETAAAVKRKGT